MRVGGPEPPGSTKHRGVQVCVGTRCGWLPGACGPLTGQCGLAEQQLLQRACGDWLHRFCTMQQQRHTRLTSRARCVFCQLDAAARLRAV